MNRVSGDPLAGVVVVHFGDPTPTRQCVASVFGDPSPVRRRVVVVDNSGTYPSEPFAGEHVLRLPHNPGFGAGANAGVGALGEDGWAVLVVLNHDIELLPGYLAAVHAELAKSGTGAAAGPLYLGSAGGALWYAGGHINFLLGTVSQARSPWRARRARKVGFIPGAAMAVSPRAWREVGGFDPSFFLYNEDLDLCLRLRRRGYSLRFVPTAPAVHHLGGATGSRERSPLYLEHLSRTRLRPFQPRAYRLYLALVHTLYVGARATVLAAGGGPRGRDQVRALWRGHREALRTVVARRPLPGAAGTREATS